MKTDRTFRTPRAAVALIAGVLVASGCASAPSHPRPGTAAPTVQSREQTGREAWAAARTAEAQGDLEQALVATVRLLSIEPDNPDVHFQAGRLQSRLGQRDTAMAAYRKVLQLAPQHWDAAQELGLLELDTGQRAKARARLEELIRFEPRRWRALNGLGVAADLERRHPAAQTYFRRALQVEPRSPVLLNNLGYSLYLSGDYAGAEQSFREAGLADPDDRKARSNLGLLMARRGEIQPAINLLEQAMPGSDARYTVGYVLMLDGRLDQAEQMLRAAIAMSPTYFAEAEQALRWIRQSREPAIPSS